jgi:hypothetical protein
MTGWIAISLGDITGIGPEVTLKALAAEDASDDLRFLLIGDTPSTLRLPRPLFSAQPPPGSPDPGTASGRSFRRPRRPGLPDRCRPTLFAP